MQLTDDFSLKLKIEFVFDDQNVIFQNIPFQDDDTERPVVVCTPEADPLQKTNGNDEVIIILEIRRIQKKVRTKIVPMPCKGDLDFLCKCSIKSLPGSAGGPLGSGASVQCFSGYNLKTQDSEFWQNSFVP